MAHLLHLWRRCAALALALSLCQKAHIARSFALCAPNKPPLISVSSLSLSAAGLLSLLSAVACSTWLLMQREVALLATMLLLATCYALVSNAVRIFKKFELKEGEVVRFSDFLRALPKAVEAADEDYDEEEMTDPQKPVM